MQFLAYIAIELLKWILLLGGRALYEWVSKKVENHERAKKNKENTKEHKDDIANNAPPGDKGKSGRKLINGEK